MKLIIIFSFVFLNSFSQSWDSIAKLAAIEAEKHFEYKIRDLQEGIQIMDHMHDLEKGKEILESMQRLMCLQHKRYRKYRKCMCQVIN